MLGKNFNHYGYDKESYLECMDMISSTNRNHFIGLNAWFIGINFIYLIFSALNLFGVTQEKVPFYLTYFLLSVLYAIIVGVFHNFSERHHIFFEYVNIAMFLSYGIFVSVFQSYMAATVYLFMISVVAFTYIDKMIRMIVSCVGVSLFFLWTSFKFKTFSIAYNDAYNMFIVITLIIPLHYFIQRMRIQQFELYYRNLQIQNELEIKSSFDTLTGLLNRGRFFSIADKLLRQEMDGFTALILFDLDEFKQINDNLGHQIGDKAIQEAGRTILGCFGLKELYSQSISNWNFKEINCLASRLGGDEFIAIIRHEEGGEAVKKMVETVLSAMNSLRFDGVDKGLKCSIGVTEIAKGDFDLDAAYKRADVAMYSSKNAGKNQINFCCDDESK